MWAFSIWRRGCAASGAVPIYNLMEDAATAEISRAQVWQWAQYGAKMSDGRTVTPELVLQLVHEIAGDGKAATMFGQMATSPEFLEFLTLRGYEELD